MHLSFCALAHKQPIIALICGKPVNDDRLRRWIGFGRMQRPAAPSRFKMLRWSAEPINGGRTDNRWEKGRKTCPYRLGGLRMDRPNQVWCAEALDEASHRFARTPIETDQPVQAVAKKHSEIRPKIAEKLKGAAPRMRGLLARLNPPAQSAALAAPPLTSGPPASQGRPGALSGHIGARER